MDPTDVAVRSVPSLSVAWLIVDSRVPDGLQRDGRRGRLGRSWWPTWTYGLY